MKNNGINGQRINLAIVKHLENAFNIGKDMLVFLNKSDNGSKSNHEDDELYFLNPDNKSFPNLVMTEV